MDHIFRHSAKAPFTDTESAYLIDTEWLVTNGLGGYASGTIGGAITRRFHGYLIAALPSPLGRTMMLNDIVENFVLPNGDTYQLGGEEREGEPIQLRGSHYLTEFRLESGLPVWTYQLDDLTVEKRILLPHGQNTTYVRYRILSGSGTAHLQLRPSVNIRQHETPVDVAISAPYTITVSGPKHEIVAPGFPPLRLTLAGQTGTLTIDSCRTEKIVYRIEQRRGYAARGDLWSPGFITAEIGPGQDATLIVSAEDWEVLGALEPQEAWDSELERRTRLVEEAHPDACSDLCGELVLAADQFIFTPAGRKADTARAIAAGHDIRTVIAGYHWFTDWGRDTMISLEGLTLTTGREMEAGFILRTFAHYVRDGLIPNMFPEGKNDGLYHTADATLWFFHAVKRYVDATDDTHLLRQILPKLVDIVDHHLRGTLFGIHVDPNDGLLSQGQEGYQLTWMDAKVDDWVVTPRRGKAVEINALWYNALCLVEGWLRDENRTAEADSIAEHAARCRASFNARFWNPEDGYLYDVIDGETSGPDASFRPNQVFSISLDHPVLDPDRWEPVLKAVRARLLTPVGLRSLAPGSKEYKAKYDGDLQTRDAAYHQGTVWAWLIGPFVDAWLRAFPDDIATTRGFLDGFRAHLYEDCVGSISEVFDAESPYTPRGCCAQAWSVAEVLRCLIKTTRAEGISAIENELVRSA